MTPAGWTAQARHRPLAGRRGDHRRCWWGQNLPMTYRLLWAIARPALQRLALITRQRGEPWARVVAEAAPRDHIVQLGTGPRMAVEHIPQPQSSVHQAWQNVVGRRRHGLRECDGARSQITVARARWSPTQLGSRNDRLEIRNISGRRNPDVNRQRESFPTPLLFGYAEAPLSSAALMVLAEDAPHDAVVSIILLVLICRRSRRPHT